jgi:hypothetical protein
VPDFIPIAEQLDDRIAVGLILRVVVRADRAWAGCTPP